MKHKLPFLQGPLSVIRPLIMGRIEQQAAIAALSMEGIGHAKQVKFSLPGEENNQE